MTALRIGTRRSDLALAQAGQVRLLLQAKGIDAQLVPMTTGGDEGQPVDVTTSPAGLKGMFIDTIVSSLRAIHTWSHSSPFELCMVVRISAPGVGSLLSWRRNSRRSAKLPDKRDRTSFVA